ncbi:MAG: hypothetical protein QOE47_438, partial [Pyrinomonadaceae bacterium]|nr:hypothetical protein [Pyrinomonadaceae bacterium]
MRLKFFVVTLLVLSSLNAEAQTRRAPRRDRSITNAAAIVAATTTTPPAARSRYAPDNDERGSASGQTLPIRRVILYSNGVAYIERRGMVSGHAEVNLSFKQSQVDDVLKSMIVLD